MLSDGSGKSSASRPKPGTIAVQAQPDGARSTRVALTVSPGSAPSMKTGPAMGLTRPKSRLATASGVESGASCPHTASTSAKATVSPGATVSAGSRALSQVMC